MSKITIIASGGGLTTAYYAGVVRALKELGIIPKIKRIVANSGAAAICTYLASNQIHLIEPIWIKLVSSGRYVNPLVHPTLRGVMDIDYLIDELIKKEFSLDIEALKQSSIQLEIGVTHAETGESHYFSKNTSLNYYELLRASCAVPYFYGKKIYLNNEPYYDGTIGSVSGLEQIQKEDETIIFILTRPPIPIRSWYIIRRTFRWLLLRKESEALQKTIWNMPQKYNEIPDFIKNLRECGKHIIVIQPKKRLPLFRIDIRLRKLRETIELGYKDTIENTELKNALAMEQNK